jgi:hypothetical protein
MQIWVNKALFTFPHRSLTFKLFSAYFFRDGNGPFNIFANLFAVKIKLFRGFWSIKSGFSRFMQLLVGFARFSLF